MVRTFLPLLLVLSQLYLNCVHVRIAGEQFDVTCFSGVSQYHCLRVQGECGPGHVSSCHLRATDFESMCQPEPIQYGSGFLAQSFPPLGLSGRTSAESLLPLRSRRYFACIARPAQRARASANASPQSCPPCARESFAPATDPWACEAPRWSGACC